MVFHFSPRNQNYPLSAFDLIGFSLYHELNYTNVLNMLRLSNIPLRSSQRNSSHPLIFAGGPCAFNPQPLADFIDFFIVGEAEEVLSEIIKCLNGPNGINRPNFLNELSKIPGIYVPALSQDKIQKRVVKDLNSTPYPTAPIVPYIEIIHDRGALEIMRGCPHSCRFCQAGWTGKPVRVKDLEVLKKQGEEIINHTGYDELSLVSLSSSDHRQIEELAHSLIKKFRDKKVSITVPSMRSDSFSMRLSREIQSVRGSGVTLAPEAGTQRLRDCIHKNITEEDILGAAKAAFEYGANLVKLYYMIGLPTETEEDLRGIAKLSNKIIELGKNIVPADRKKRLKIAISLSTFIPKPHTPFQWERMLTIPEILETQKFIRSLIKNRDIEIRWHDAKMSFLEGVFARGDRKLGEVLEKACALGCKFDAWNEHFNFAAWQEAFSSCGIDPLPYTQNREYAETLPWDNIDTGISQEILIRESKKAKECNV